MYSNYYSYSDSGLSTLGIIAYILILAIVIVLIIIPLWKIYIKAGKPGWASIIPIYNIIVYLEIIGKPWWWILLLIFVPVADIIFAILMTNEMSKCFGKDAGFTVGLIFLPFIFYPILGYGKAQYIKPETAY
ncbi:MAG TPA: DUF5684 domain-containing protein [Bacteroidota bacterium]|nr:DUF5684 domain-containing protein [Candidatus Kapabacteria bacterium]HRS02316.1 DUF5684 domain-containing protein [Bacteroidota bacterium]